MLTDCELKLELIKLSKEFISDKFYHEHSEFIREIESNNNINNIKPLSEFPTSENIIEIAKVFYDFVFNYNASTSSPCTNFNVSSMISRTEIIPCSTTLVETV